MGFLDRLLGRNKEETGEMMSEGEAKSTGEGMQDKAGEMTDEAKSTGEGMQDKAGGMADEAKNRADDVM
jgi:hypothetical protein